MRGMRRSGGLGDWIQIDSESSLSAVIFDSLFLYVVCGLGSVNRLVETSLSGLVCYISTKLAG